MDEKNNILILDFIAKNCPSHDMYNLYNHEINFPILGEHHISLYTKYSQLLIDE